MCCPQFAPYSSHPKRDDLPITALTPPHGLCWVTITITSITEARNDHPVYTLLFIYQTVQSETKKNSKCF